MTLGLGIATSLRTAIAGLAATGLVLLLADVLRPPSPPSAPPPASRSGQVCSRRAVSARIGSGAADEASADEGGAANDGGAADAGGAADEGGEGGEGGAVDSKTGSDASQPASEGSDRVPGDALGDATQPSLHDGTLRLVRKPLRQLITTPIDEHPLDAALSQRLWATGHEPNWRKFYTGHLPSAVASIAAENTTRDPHLRPIGASGACKRPLGEWP